MMYKDDVLLSARWILSSSSSVTVGVHGLFKPSHQEVTESCGEQEIPAGNQQQEAPSQTPNSLHGFNVTKVLCVISVFVDVFFPWMWRHDLQASASAQLDLLVQRSLTESWALHSVRQSSSVVEVHPLWFFLRDVLSQRATILWMSVWVLFSDCHCAELDATPAELCFDPKAILLFWQHISMCHSYCFISPPRKPFVSINFRMLLESNFCYLLRVGDPSHSPRIILTKAQSLLTAESWCDWLTANLREEKILWTGVHFTTKLTCARRRVFNDARQEMMWVPARLGVVLVQKSRPSSPGGDRKSTWKEK